MNLNRPLLIAFIILHVFLFIFFLKTGLYQPVFMLIHIFVVITLWAAVLIPKNISQFFFQYRKDMVIAVSLLLIAFIIRLYKVEELPPGMWGDEISVARSSIDLFSSSQILPYSLTYLHPTPLLYLNAFFIEHFGRTLTAIRLSSVIFGALDVGALYILLRLFFRRHIAGIGALFFTTLYSHIVISRFAYEQTASIFFQIISLIFLYKAYKTQSIKYMIGFALSLGAGLYTYFNFRLYAALALFLIFLLTLKTFKDKLKLYAMFGTISALFISSTPLLSFILLHPQEYWSRPMQISVFNQNLPISEIRKELAASTARSFGSLGFVGDPNPRHNPSNSPYIDVFISALFVGGVIYLFRKRKRLLFLLLFLASPFFLSDIFSLERIPEFHYYGIGHPHALRLSGIIPIIILISMFGLNNALVWGERKNKYMFHPVFIIGIILISIMNLYLFFNQKANLPSYLYNYKVNQTKLLMLANFLNKTSIKEVYMPQKYSQYDHIRFFVQRKNFHVLEPATSLEVFSKVTENSLVLVEVNENSIHLLNEISDTINNKNLHFQIQTIKNPLGGDEIAIILPFEKINY